MPTTDNSLLALDIGAVRIGVAVASAATRLPRPLTTLNNDENFTEALKQIIDNERANGLVVGLPRGLDGQETSQTEFVRKFLDQLKSSIDLPIYLQDEALSSTRAREELEARGKTFQKGDIDALAATFILEDYLIQNRI